MDKPDKYPDWATEDQIDPVSGQSNVVEPPSAVKQSGWHRHQKPPRQWLNWLHRKTCQWIKYLDEAIDALDFDDIGGSISSGQVPESAVTQYAAALNNTAISNVLQMRVVGTSLNYNSIVGLTAVPGLTINFTPLRSDSFLLIEVDDTCRALTNGDSSTTRGALARLSLNIMSTVLSHGSFFIVHNTTSASEHAASIRMSAIVPAGSTSARNYFVSYAAIGSDCELARGESDSVGIIKVTELLSASFAAPST